MRIFDSNLIIYSYNPEFYFIHEELLKPNTYVSEITKLEVLGYSKITNDEKEFYERLFSTIVSIIPIDSIIIDQAIALRQTKKMSLGDSIIAATSLINKYELNTHNVKDFDWIPNLKIFDPLK